MSLSASQDFHIRPANNQDVPPLAPILAYSFYAEVNQSMLTSWLYPLLCWGIRLDLYTKFAETSADSICLVAIDLENKQTVATIELHFRQLTPFWSAPTKSAYLSSLAVDPNWRRNGIAMQLLHSAETLAKEKGYQQIYLHVINHNQAAQNLYQKANYQLAKSESNLITWLLGIPHRLLLHKNLN